MKISLYNSFTNRIETFSPIEPGIMRMYNCGLTVYDYGHIGNFRSFLFADVLRRFFEFTGYRVQQVMNITDVGHMTEDQLADGGGEDKMSLAAARLNKDPFQIADYFTQVFLEDARQLRLKVADEYPQQMPKATAHVQEMIQLIEKLLRAGHAYIASDGAVYFDVTSFPHYGRLSGNTLDRLSAGAGGRVSEEATAHKRGPHDFLLWKPDEKHIMKWPSPWGIGYPGWHIECSAMAMHTLGVPTLDIHTGGEDNIFPHHECEIAQSTGATGKPFANYWMHARHLLIDGKKMSKSKGNFFTVRDLLGRNVAPSVLRYELIRTHYRSNANFTMKGLEDSERAVRRLRAIAGDPVESTQCDESLLDEFTAALAEDLNIAAAMGAVFKWAAGVDSPTESVRATLWKINQVLGILEPDEVAASNDSDDAKFDKLCLELDNARADKDFATSDRIRDELIAMGLEVQITNTGTKWRRKIQTEATR